MADELQQPAQVDEVAPAADSDRGAIESLLDQAQSALSSLDEPTPQLPPGVKPFELKDLMGAAPANEAASLDLLRDVQLDLKIELGRTQMHLEDVLRMKQGAVVTLDKLAGDPVDIYANGRLIARGEVLVLNDNFCVRVAELISGEAAA
jgi:flagellar motor switch protein FliN/FliY